MYRPELDKRDKGGAIAAVVAVHAGLLFALLNITGRIDLPDPQSAMRIFDVSEVPPPPIPPPPPPQQREQAKPKEKEGGSAPKNIKSEATPVVAPKPRIVIPLVPQIATSETPRQGTAPTQGASDVRGPGTGAGGAGTGTGSGAGGSGTGGGGLAEVRTRLATRPLGGRDFPDALLDAWPRGAWVFVRFRVDANGTIIQCIVDRGSGVAAIDAAVCGNARERMRYRPALNRNGQRVADWAAYGQRPPR